MKKKVSFLIGTATLVAVMAFNINFMVKGNNGHLNLSSIEQLAVVDGEGSVDDELDVCMIQSCDDGTTCECTGCEKGETDCTPTCPCCPE